MAGGVTVFAAAIRQQESGGDYGIIGQGGHYGAYQFDQGTWITALNDAGLGGTVYANETPNLAPASVQDAAAEALMSRYYTQFGNSWFNVAEAWYGGPGAVGNPNLGGGPGFPTVGQYANEVMAIYNSLAGGSSSPPITGVPVTTLPMTAQFSSDVAFHYTGIIGPLWDQMNKYANALLTPLVSPPKSLV